MLILVKTFKDSFKILREDKRILFLSLFPTLICLGLYFICARYFSNKLMSFLPEILQSFFFPFVEVLTSMIIYFIATVTFMIVVSIVSSPFNDRISQIIARKETLYRVYTLSVVKIIMNEIKKIFLLSFISIFILIINLFIPFLLPIGFILSSYLVAASFLDYSWCHDNLLWKDCLNNLKEKYIQNMIAGAFFLGLMMIPIVNVFMIPFGVIFFSLLYRSQRTMASSNRLEV